MTPLSPRSTGVLIAGVLALAALPGCITHRPSNPAATQPTTAVDPKQAEPQFWLAQADVASVEAPDFQTLWNASEETAREYLFAIDRRDYRGGLITTKPMLSKTWFELWRKDAATTYDVKQDSLAGIRRTAYFQIRQRADGGYVLIPKVLVERQSKVEARYLQQDVKEKLQQREYYYPIRRDPALEKKLAESLERRIHPATPAAG